MEIENTVLKKSYAQKQQFSGRPAVGKLWGWRPAVLFNKPCREFRPVRSSGLRTTALCLRFWLPLFPAPPHSPRSTWWLRPFVNMLPSHGETSFKTVKGIFTSRCPYTIRLEETVQNFAGCNSPVWTEPWE